MDFVLSLEISVQTLLSLEAKLENRFLFDLRAQKELEEKWDSGWSFCWDCCSLAPMWTVAHSLTNKDFIQERSWDPREESRTPRGLPSAHHDACFAPAEVCGIAQSLWVGRKRWQSDLTVTVQRKQPKKHILTIERYLKKKKKVHRSEGEKLCKGLWDMKCSPPKK